MCHLTLEPGFYRGAMFVHYTFLVAYFLAGGIGTYYLLSNPDT